LILFHAYFFTNFLLFLMLWPTILFCW
jgi:hypothetical protein